MVTGARRARDRLPAPVLSALLSVKTQLQVPFFFLLSGPRAGAPGLARTNSTLAGRRIVLRVADRESRAVITRTRDRVAKQ